MCVESLLAVARPEMPGGVVALAAVAAVGVVVMGSWRIRDFIRGPKRPRHGAITKG